MDNQTFMIFAQVLEKSAKKHGGDKPITISHMANLAKYAIKISEMNEKKRNDIMEQIDEEFWADYSRYGLGAGVDGD